MVKLIESVLLKSLSDLSDSLNPDDVLIQLVSNGCLSLRDQEQIESQGTRRKKCVELIGVLMTKDDRALDVLMAAIHENGTQNHLVQLLEKSRTEVEGITSTKCEAATKRRIWFDILEPVFNFTGRCQELQALHELLTQNPKTGYQCSQMTSISGLGGIGKTTLARKYALDQHDFYENVVWINAETAESIRASFHKLAESLSLSLQLDSVGLGDGGISKMVADIYSWFGDKKVLFIFDNVEEASGPNGIKPFLPSRLDPSQNRPYILLTSRRTNILPAGHLLKLDVLSEEDATELVQSALPTASKEQTERLTLKLGRLPLALQQALAFINETGLVGDDSAISIYLTNYELNTAKLLDDPSFLQSLGSDEYRTTVYLTWKVTFDQIHDSELGLVALKLLKYLVYFSPDNIFLEFFVKFCFLLGPIRQGQVGSIGSYPNLSVAVYYMSMTPAKHVELVNMKLAIGLLRKFSIISCARNTPDGNTDGGEIIRVHRLVQDVVKLHYCKNEQLTLTRIVGLLESIHEDTEYSDQILLHGRHILSQNSKYETRLKDEFPGLNIKMSSANEILRTLLRAIPGLAEGNAISLLNKLDNHPEFLELAVGFAGKLVPGRGNESVSTYLQMLGDVDNEVSGGGFAGIRSEVRNLVASCLSNGPNCEQLTALAHLISFLNHKMVSFKFLGQLVQYDDSVLELESCLNSLESHSIVKRLPPADGHYIVDYVAQRIIRSCLDHPRTIQRLHSMVQFLESEMAALESVTEETVLHAYVIAKRHYFEQPALIQLAPTFLFTLYLALRHLQKYEEAKLVRTNISTSCEFFFEHLPSLSTKEQLVELVKLVAHEHEFRDDYDDAVEMYDRLIGLEEKLYGRSSHQVVKSRQHRAAVNEAIVKGDFVSRGVELGVSSTSTQQQLDAADERMESVNTSVDKEGFASDMVSQMTATRTYTVEFMRKIKSDMDKSVRPDEV